MEAVVISGEQDQRYNESDIKAFFKDNNFFDVVAGDRMFFIDNDYRNLIRLLNSMHNSEMEVIELFKKLNTEERKKIICLVGTILSNWPAFKTKFLVRGIYKAVYEVLSIVYNNFLNNVSNLLSTPHLIDNKQYESFFRDFEIELQDLAPETGSVIDKKEALIRNLKVLFKKIGLNNVKEYPYLVEVFIDQITIGIRNAISYSDTDQLGDMEHISHIFYGLDVLTPLLLNAGLILHFFMEKTEYPEKTVTHLLKELVMIANNLCD